MLQNVTLLAIVAIHIAANELPKVYSSPSPTDADTPTLRWILFITWRTFGGSFAAVWIATIASQVTFYSIFKLYKINRLLYRLHFKIFILFIIFIIFIFHDLWWFLQIFSKCCWIFIEIADFSMKISLIFVGISGNCRQLPEVTIFCAISSK